MRALLLVIVSLMVGCGETYTQIKTVNIIGEGNREEREELAEAVIQHLLEGDLKKNILKSVEGVTLQDLDNGLEVEAKTRVYKGYTGGSDAPRVVVQIVCTFSSSNKDINALAIAESCQAQVEEMLGKEAA